MKQLKCEHDLDDGLANGALEVEELIEELKELAENIKPLSSKDDEYNEIMSLISEIKRAKKRTDNSNRKFIEKEDIIRSEIVSSVTGFFIRKLIDISEENIETHVRDINKEKFKKNPVATKELVCFNKIKDKDRDRDDKKSILKNFEDIIKSKVINSHEVNCFDGKAVYIINKLFKAYYSNPLQLPDNTLRRIDREIKQIDSNWVNIRKGKKQKVDKQIKTCQGIEMTGNDKKDNLKQRKFIRGIIDFIAGMTDNFAKNQFEKLYLP